MKFSVLALDYDGTIAQGGVLDPEVRAAIADVRAQGIAVVIVSGRAPKRRGGLHWAGCKKGQTAP